MQAYAVFQVHALADVDRQIVDTVEHVHPGPSGRFSSAAASGCGGKLGIFKGTSSQRQSPQLASCVHHLHELPREARIAKRAVSKPHRARAVRSDHRGCVCDVGEQTARPNMHRHHAAERVFKTRNQEPRRPQANASSACPQRRRIRHHVSLMPVSADFWRNRRSKWG